MTADRPDELAEMIGDLTARIAVTRQLTLQLAAFLCEQMDAPLEAAADLTSDLRAAFPAREAGGPAQKRFVKFAQADIAQVEATLRGLLGHGPVA